MVFLLAGFYMLHIALILVPPNRVFWAPRKGGTRREIYLFMLNFNYSEIIALLALGRGVLLSLRHL